MKKLFLIALLTLCLALLSIAMAEEAAVTAVAAAEGQTEAGCIPFFDGEYWYLVSGPDFDPDGNPAVKVIYSATPAELLAD